MSPRVYRFTFIGILLLVLLSCSFPGSRSTTQPLAPPTNPPPPIPRNSPPPPSTSPANNIPSTAQPSPGSNLQTPDECLFGYWEVDSQSLADMGNALITLPNLQILRVSPSIVYVFSHMDPASYPAPYKMETWYTDVLINAEFKSSPDTDWKPMDIRINGVLTGWFVSETPGQIFVNTDHVETSLQVTDLWIDGVPVGSGIDISDMSSATGPGNSISYICQGNDVLALQPRVSPQPFLLHRTSSSTIVRPD